MDLDRKRPGHRPAGGLLIALALGMALTVSLYACTPKEDSAKATTGEPDTLTNQAPAETGQRERELAALAFIAYTGEQLTGSEADIEATLKPCMKNQLAHQPITRNRYQLLWGPATYKFDGARYDDNMMYVVRDIEDPTALVIAIRGTNSVAVLDWLLEDFTVARTEPWTYGESPEHPKPRVSEGTYRGLNVLQTMTPEADADNQSRTLREFLKHQVATEDIEEITVTGHSLGGALAPALALWLQDTRDYWNPDRDLTLHVVPLAGPTPGNRDFAAYYDAQLGAHTTRLHNPYDTVPLAWNQTTLRRIADLYAEQDIKPSPAIRAAIELSKGLAAGHDYTQIRADMPPLAGTVYTGESGFLQQVSWQHTCGYQCALNLNTELLPITPDCSTTPPPPCPQCP